MLVAHDKIMTIVAAPMVSQMKAPAELAARGAELAKQMHNYSGPKAEARVK